MTVNLLILLIDALTNEETFRDLARGKGTLFKIVEGAVFTL